MSGAHAVPDVLVANDGRTFAVRGPGGRFAFHHTGGATFATREWLSADADGRDVRDRRLGDGLARDPSGCIGKLADGALVAYVTAPDAFDEDCARAVLVVTMHSPPPGCAARVIGRALLRERGALGLRRTESRFAINSVRPESFDRPWSPTPPRPRTTAAQNAEAGTSPRPAPRDATPRPEDIEADQ